MLSEYAATFESLLFSTNSATQSIAALEEYGDTVTGTLTFDHTEWNIFEAHTCVESSGAAHLYDRTGVYNCKPTARVWPYLRGTLHHIDPRSRTTLPTKAAIPRADV